MRKIATLILSLISLVFYAQETIVVGNVIDQNTGLPIENVNVYFRNTNIGCTTNAEGLFLIRTNLDRERTLIFSAIGYRTQHYKVQPDQYLGIQVEMQENNNIISEIIVSPDQNQALQLIRRVRNNRTLNDPTIQTDFSLPLDITKSLFISQINSRHLNRQLWKNLQNSMILMPDSSLVIPLYTSSQQFQYYNQTLQPTGTPNQHSAILTQTDYNILLENIDEYINFYQNNITILNNSFISPLASYSSNHYLFYLADSTCTTDGNKTYELHFRTKNNFMPTFNGTMLIDSASAALIAIQANIPRQVSINYLTNLSIYQQFNSNHLLDNEQLSFIFDFAIKTDSSHIFPTALIQRQTIASNSIRPSTPILSNTPTNISDSNIIASMQTLESTPIIRVAKFIAHIINTGNIPTGEYIDIGPVNQLFGYSDYEGVHVGLPLTTNQRLSKHIELSAAISYGFCDKALKGYGQIRALLPTDNRHMIGAAYHDQYIHTEISQIDRFHRENSIFSGYQDLAHMLFGNIQRPLSFSTTDTRLRQFKIWTENQWTDNLETQFIYSTGRMGYGDVFSGYHNIPSFKFSNLQAYFRLGWKEKKYDIFMRHYYLHSNYPVLRIGIEAGHYQLDNQTDPNLYSRLSLLLQQDLNIGRAGKLNYLVQAGIILGKVPYPLLEHFNANQSYTYDPYSFTFMNAYQYAADKYIFTHINYNMNGLLFNRIPGLRYLHLRELFCFKFAYGSLSNQHQTILPLPTTLTHTNIPYTEAGIGIGNILRIADVYAIFRLTNLHDNSTPWWGIRARFAFGL